MPRSSTKLNAGAVLPLALAPNVPTTTVAVGSGQPGFLGLATCLSSFPLHVPLELVQVEVRITAPQHMGSQRLQPWERNVPCSSAKLLTRAVLPLATA